MIHIAHEKNHYHGASQESPGVQHLCCDDGLAVLREPQLARAQGFMAFGGFGELGELEGLE